MQATRRVRQHHVSADFLGFFDGLKQHTCRVGAVLAVNDLTTDALPPDDQLLHRSGAKRVARRQNAFLARLM